MKDQELDQIDGCNVFDIRRLRQTGALAGYVEKGRLTLIGAVALLVKSSGNGGSGVSDWAIGCRAHLGCRVELACRVQFGCRVSMPAQGTFWQCRVSD